MESKTTIHTLLRGTEIHVPEYQRAYSWDSDMTSDSASISSKQVAVFLNDIMDYISFEHQTHYYLGHFLKDFELHLIADVHFVHHHAYYPKHLMKYRQTTKQVQRAELLN